MHCVVFFLFFIATVSTLNEWFQVGSKCFQINPQPVNQTDPIQTCDERSASWIPISDPNTFAHIKSRLNSSYTYWMTTLKNTMPDCFSESLCAICDLEKNAKCPECKIDENGLSSNNGRNYSCGFICSKPAKLSTLVNISDYDFRDLCGVEIMPNCENLPCEDICQSHHDCDQFAKMLNVCVNIKNVSQTHSCVVKLRPDLELYNLESSC